MTYHLIFLDGYAFIVDRDFAFRSLRENKAVACVEVRMGGEVVERIER
jgi:hypothetical protein